MTFGESFVLHQRMITSQFAHLTCSFAAAGQTKISIRLFAVRGKLMGSVQRHVFQPLRCRQLPWVVLEWVSRGLDSVTTLQSSERQMLLRLAILTTLAVAQGATDRRPRPPRRRPAGSRIAPVATPTRRRARRRRRAVTRWIVCAAAYDRCREAGSSLTSTRRSDGAPRAIMLHMLPIDLRRSRRPGRRSCLAGRLGGRLRMRETSCRRS